MNEPSDSYDETSAKSRKLENLAIIFFLPIVAGFVQSFLILMFWNWFVEPLGLPNIDYWHAYGLNILISFIRYEDKKPDESMKATDDIAKGNDEPLRNVRRQYGIFATFLFLGWVAHLLMGKG